MNTPNTPSRRQFLAAGAVAAGVALTANRASAAPAGLDICYMDAVELAAKLRKKEVSAVEVMTAFYDRIEAVNPKVNAIVALLKRDDALALAKQADADLTAGKPVGKLHGLPWAVKDMEDVKGFPTTKGCTVFKDYMPKADGLLAERLRPAPCSSARPTCPSSGPGRTPSTRCTGPPATRST